MPSSFQEDKSQRAIALLKHKEEEESMQILAQKYKIPYLDLSIFPIELDAITITSEREARDAEMAAFQVTGKNVSIAVRNPEKPATKSILQRLESERWRVTLYLVSHYSLEHAWEFYKKIPQMEAAEAGAIQLHTDRLTALLGEIANLDSVASALQKVSDGRTTEALEVILAGAIALEASDVHIEPEEHAARLRLRLDGVLHNVAEIPPKLYGLLLSRIKLISELKLNIHDRAQDGRFTVHAKNINIEVRTSSLPGPYGENVVMRILNPKTLEVAFEDLGMQPWVRETMEGELKKPNGMIVTTGPTGSGKTTTLYTMLKKIHTPEIKIITLEDPIEYHLTGVEQTQVDPTKGYDFAKGLRAIVRQDPDVILVGEIRDLETADTAANAALTGHLVFTTLHTNNAAGAIPRLLNLGIKAASIAPALNVTMAQRLVRTLCTTCRIPATLSAAQKKEIHAELTVFPKGVPVPDESAWTVFSAAPRGCPSCSGMGYKGRIGVFEIILINDALERLIMQSPTELDLKKEAALQGHITMSQDSILKILAGVTDFAERNRVVGAPDPISEK